MKKQKITKYTKRLIMANIYYNILIECRQNSEKIYCGYNKLARDYVYKHLPLCNAYTLTRLTWRWIRTSFNNDGWNILYQNPSEVINKCKEYGINLDDIKNLQGYIN